MSRHPAKQALLKVQRALANLDMLPKIARTAAAVYLLRKPVIRQVGIALTYACPCRCPFCSAGNIQESPGQLLTTREIETLIEDFDRLGALSICFSGGEPLLHKDILRLVRLVRKKGCSAP
ncbi:MAG: radical SAM protein [Deltaproteobacteria bacterium]|nr:radical SAM protein [Deltaproteobacteria bacterium]